MPYRPEKKHRLETWKIKYFIEIYDTIDCQPVGQRLPVLVQDNEKARDILRTILEGDGLGQITLMKLASRTGPFKTYALESIDGGHRKRFIYEFRRGDFSVEFTDSDGKVVEKFYSDLSEDERADFLETEFSVDIYKTLSVQEKGRIFRNLNTTTDVRFMEKINSYGDISIANFVRELVRKVMGIDNEYHKLFNYCDGSSTNYKYLSFDNNRLKHDQALARIVLRYAKYPKDLLGGSPDEEIEDMYASEKIADSVKKKVIEHLNFLHSMALSKKKWSKKGLGQHDFKALSFLYFWMMDNYGLFHIKDSEKFIEIYLKAKKVVTDIDGKYEKKTMTDGSGYTFRRAYTKYIAAPQSHKKVQAATTILANEMTAEAIERVIIVKDKTRCFSPNLKEAKLVDQEGKCYIDGEELDYKHAHAAHIVAHSKGGKTDYNNLAMVRKEHNQDMGQMDLEEYKCFLRTDKTAA